MAIRDGFLIPNANTYAPDYQTAQPDQGDFLILGNSKFGVITGAEVSLSGYTASVGAGPHIVVVDNAVYAIGAGQSISIAGKGQNPRFDLVVFDSVNGLSVVDGVPSVNPVFPDITDTMVVLAAIFVPASGGSTNPSVIDKRNFLQQANISFDVSTLLRNYASNGTTIKFNIDGNGRISWNGDTHLERTGVGVITATNELRAAVITATTSATVNGKKVVTAETIDWGATGSRPNSGSGDPPEVGDIFVDNISGDISVYKPDTSGSNNWVSLQPNLPAGSVINSFASPDRMAGWLPLLGQTVTEAEAGNLWDLFPEWQTGVDSMVLPDMRGRFALGAGTIDSGTPGFVNTVSGSRLDDKGTVQVPITVNNMPAHTHRTGTTTVAAGSHTHAATTEAAGTHSHSMTAAGGHNHSVNDPGHRHGWTGGVPIVAVIPGLPFDTCMDIPFSDTSHSYRTKPEPLSWPASSNISLEQAGTHSHPVDSAGSHTHSLTTVSAGGHTHDLPAHNSVGNGVPVSFRPPSLTLYFYIKI